MAWSRLDDTWYDHPKLMRLPDRLRNAGAGLRDRALSWSNRHMADGHVPNAVLRTLDCTNELRGALISVGLFEDEGSGVYIHDYPEFNETRVELIERRERAAEAGRLGGLAKKRNAKRSASSPLSEGRSDPLANGQHLPSDSPIVPYDGPATNARVRNAPEIARPPAQNARPGPSPIPDKRRESPSSDHVGSEADSAVHRADEILEVFS